MASVKIRITINTIQFQNTSKIRWMTKGIRQHLHNHTIHPYIPPNHYTHHGKLQGVSKERNQKLRHHP